MDYYYKEVNHGTDYWRKPPDGWDLTNAEWTATKGKPRTRRGADTCLVAIWWMRCLLSQTGAILQSICNCQNEATSWLVSSSEQHESVVGVHSVYAVRFGNIPTCTCLLGVFHTWRWTLSDHSLLFQLNVDAHATTWKYTKWVPQINATSNTNNNWDRQRSSSWRKPRTDK
jgi:hypothetical protein